MVRHTLKVLQDQPQDFKSLSDHFGTFCIEWLTLIKHLFISVLRYVNKKYFLNNKKSFYFLDRRQTSPIRSVLLVIIVWLVTQFSQKRH